MSAPNSRLRTISPFRRLIGLVAPAWRWISLSVLLGFATIASSIFLMATSAYIIARAALHPSISDLSVAIVGVRFFGISRGLFRYLERYVSHQVTFRLLAALRVWFYRHLEPLAPARLLAYRSGDLLARIVSDIDTLQHFYVRVIAPPAAAILVAVLMAALMGRFDIRLALVALLFLALAGAGIPVITLALGREPGRQLVHARADLAAALIDGVQGQAEIVAFGQQAAYLERVNDLSGSLAHWQGRMASIGGLSGAFGGLLALLGTLAALGIAIPLVNQSRLDGVYLPVIALAVLASFEAVLPLSIAAQYLENNLEAARRLFEIVDTDPAVRDPASPEPPQGTDLVVENLSFRYAPHEPRALDGLCFTLAPGRCIAVVGPSGAGKSTLTNVLLRFWEYEEGSVRLGGIDLRRIEQEALRRQIGVVAQNTYLFNTTIRENLLIARRDAAADEIVQAAQQAQIHDFIKSLPQGYDTWIGEQGLQLSGGERQRLAIARALLKNAPILVLDEATANLDAVTERSVMGAIHTLMAGRSTLISTHRLTGLDVADEILVLHEGRIVERGRHADLLQSDGFYRRLWDIQRDSMTVER